MELSRRDALVALAGAGVAGAGALAADRLDGDGEPSPAAPGEGPTDPLDREALESLVAVAHVVYPDAVKGVPGFVETYAVGRVRERQSYREGLEAALAALEERADAWHGAPLADLAPETRDTLLREVGADSAEPVPDGTTAERVRYYVVNELLYALYTSPAGGRLLGIENPQGHPGGLGSYQRGPTEGTEREGTETEGTEKR